MEEQLGSILWYLSNTYSLKEYREKFKSLEGEEFWLLPWEAGNITYNAGVTMEYLRDFVSRHNNLRLEEEEISSQRRIFLKGDGIDKTVQKAELPQIISIKNLMNLTIFLYTREEQVKNNVPVKMEDALFFLKNTVMIPDDFMPAHLMGNVEGSMTISSEILRKEFQFLPGRTSIFLFPENPLSRFSRIRYLYTPMGMEFDALPPLTSLTEILQRSFGELQEDSRYRDFEDSRLLKTVLYQMEVRKNREIRKPYFTPEKAERLIQLGIPLIESKIPERISANDVREIREGKIRSGSSLAEDWFSKTVSIH